MPNPYTLLAALLVAIGLSVASYGFGHSVATDKWTATVAEMKADASTTLAAETKRVLEAERAAQALVDQLETTHAKNRQSLASAYTDAFNAAALAGGLRD